MADREPQVAGGAVVRKRAFGRSLADFRVEGATTPNGLHPAEERLLSCAARGEVCHIASNRPESATSENIVRGPFLRFLMLGGDENAPVHEKGIALYGAVIESDVDLEGAKNVCSFELAFCHASQVLNGRNGTFGNIALRNCQLARLNFASSSVFGDVELTDSFISGETLFSGAQISGWLNCGGSTFHNHGGVAIYGEHITVSGGVFIGGGFSAKGSVIFWDANIGDDFFCAGGKFEHLCDTPYGAEDKDLTSSHALDMGGAKIGGTLFLFSRRYLHAHIQGSLSLADARATRLRNHPNAWPQETDARHFIELDGFLYDRLSGGTPTDARTCKRWLLRQPPTCLNEDFRPQPYTQLANVLREMGHEADARQIAMLKQSLQQKRKKFWMEPFAWSVAALWGFSCGYGYRPSKLAVTLIVLWLAFGFLYQFGAAHGGFAPKDAQVWTNQVYNDSCGQNWTDCAELKSGAGGKVGEILAFNPFTYSADMLLPAIDLGQRSAWTPMWREVKVTAPLMGEVTLPKWTLRAAAWTENILGVSGVILIGAILSGVIKRD
jgi:hypothetical protein